LISEDGDTCDMTMNVTDYVRHTPCDACQAFRQLPKLSRLFKDNIAYVLLGRLRQALNLPTLYGFMGLLPELKVLIMSYLDAPSLCVMARVCKELKTMTREPSLWRRLYLKTFGSYRDNSLSHNWYQVS
ncbi:F-box only protein 7-like, partial [Lingula anatina]|uniref:F-box only protein 7-like n=1 Tax=Lingula anatina TaxID=7574 RepID=A0A1S3KBF1_LINAN